MADLRILGSVFIDGVTNMVDTYITLYTVGAQSQVVVPKVLCCNQNDPGDVNIAKVYIATVPPNESINPPVRSSYLFYNAEIIPNGFPVSDGQIVLQANSKIVVRSNKANVNFIAYGDVA